jgi:hypothetical protein
VDDEVITESAKATREVAKAAGKAIDAGREAGGWLNRIFGKAIGESVGLLWTDRVVARRVAAVIYDWERLSKLFHKTEKRMLDKGIKTTRIPPPKIVLPLLENATMEYEEDLHTLWANLLAAALDSTAEEIHRKYVSTLAELTGRDASVLQKMYEDSKLPISNKVVSDSTLKYGPGIDGTYSHNEESVTTLNRLGLIAPAYIEFETYDPPGHDDRYGDYGPTRDKVQVRGDLASVTLTAFGLAFCRAVISS